MAYTYLNMASGYDRLILLCRKNFKKHFRIIFYFSILRCIPDQNLIPKDLNRFNYMGSVALLWRNAKCNVKPGLSFQFYYYAMFIYDGKRLYHIPLQIHIVISIYKIIISYSTTKIIISYSDTNLIILCHTTGACKLYKGFFKKEQNLCFPI